MKPEHEYEQDLEAWEKIIHPEPKVNYPAQAARKKEFEAFREKYHNYPIHPDDVYPQTTR